MGHPEETHIAQRPCKQHLETKPINKKERPTFAPVTSALQKRSNAPHSKPPYTTKASTNTAQMM